MTDMEDENIIAKVAVALETCASLRNTKKLKKNNEPWYEM
jgi:hypothetical protein